jgi:uncharacterized protein (DUF2236 family)
MVPRLEDFASEGVLLAGAGRAILLQLANPAVGRGVARHSDFASDPLRRLRNTLSYVYVVACGGPDEVERVVRRVDAAHGPVRGEGYDAVDPALQLWVAATLYETAVDVHERVVGPIPPEEAEAIYREYAILGTALQVPAELWPRDLAAFRRFWEQSLEATSVDEEVLGVSHALLHPRHGPLWMRAAMPLVRLVTAGLLPDRLRSEFELPWDARRQRRFDRLIRLLARLNRTLPAWVRHWPRDYCLTAFRRR